MGFKQIGKVLVFKSGGPTTILTHQDFHEIILPPMLYCLSVFACTIYPFPTSHTIIYSLRVQHIPFRVSHTVIFPGFYPLSPVPL